MLYETRRTLMVILAAIVAAAAWAGGSGETTVETRVDRPGVPVAITVEEGEHFFHRLKVMPLVSVKNAPQMVVWAERPNGDFLETLFVTSSIGRQEWRGAPGDDTPAEEIRRAEALPVWAHRRGRIYEDGLRVPTREEPMADAVTSATPQGGFDLSTTLPAAEGGVVVYFEVNASTDFNDAYPRTAERGDAGWSGGEWGSGQPSLVYRAALDSTAPTAQVELELAGHGSPDGSDGEIHSDLSGVTTARSIVSSVTLTIDDRDPQPQAAAAR